jgi:hypothetical protein
LSHSTSLPIGYFKGWWFWGKMFLRFYFLRIFLVWGIFFFFVVVLGFEFGFTLAKQTLYHLSCSASTFWDVM